MSVLALDEATWRVRYASANVATHLEVPPGAVMGRPIEELIGALATAQLRRTAEDALFSRRAMYVDRLARPGPKGGNYLLVGHRHAGNIIVEGEAQSRFGGLTGLRFNIGKVEGGIKANVIAPSAEVRFGFRPLPSHDIDALHARFGACAAAGALERYEETFRGPSLPAGDIATAEERRLAARDLADELHLPIGNAVDFWTEASLFSQAGLTAFVYGPGDIAQAHTADEFVMLEQLQRYAESINRILGSHAP